MDFLSRDQLRQAVEDPRPVERRRPGPRRVEGDRERARSGRQRLPGRSCGARRLSPDRRRPRRSRGGTRLSPEPGPRVRRFVLRHAAGFYLGAIALLTAALVGAAVAYARQRRRRDPRSQLAVAAAGAAAAQRPRDRVHPARRRRTSSARGACRASTSRRRAGRCPHHGHHPDHADQRARRGHARSTTSKCSRWATSIRASTSPSSATSPTRRRADAPGRRRDPRPRARRASQALNARFGAEHADRFFLFHRDRQWNVGEHAWIGWERKRGKIEEFNRLLRGATDTSFSTQVGELDVLPSIRYCITLDSDTRLPRDAAKRLIGIIAHPLNRPRIDRTRRARHRRLRHPAAARQRDDGERGGIAVRPHLRRPHRRRSVHDRRLGRLSGPLRRRDLHRQGPLRRRRVHGRARGARAGERAAVARPVRRTLRAHGAGHRRRGRGRLSVERARARAPAASLGARRLADPVVAVSVRAVAHGVARNRLPLIARWKISRQPAAQPAGAGHARCCSSSAGRRCRAMPRSWTALPASPPGASLPVRRARAAARAQRRDSRGASSCGRRARTCRRRWRASGCSSTFMANQACERLHAIGITLVRLGVTRRRLLEWETTAASAARTRPDRSGRSSRG